MRIVSTLRLRPATANEACGQRCGHEQEGRARFRNCREVPHGAIDGHIPQLSFIRACQAIDTKFHLLAVGSETGKIEAEIRHPSLDRLSGQRGLTEIVHASARPDTTGQVEIESADVQCELGELRSDGPALTYVTVITGDDERQIYTVEHHPEGDTIEWESSVGVTAANTGNVLRSLGAGQHAVPVLAALDDYYNYDFADPEKEICVRLQDPKTNELLSYGYLSRDSDQMEDLLAALQDASPDAPMPLMIEVQGEANSPATKQMRITPLLQTGWRTDSVVAGVN